MNNAFVATIVGFAFAAGIPSARALCLGSAYHGQVIDADTKQPLEGAAVAVIWYQRALVGIADSNSGFHKAVEALTDGGGKFFICNSPGFSLNPFVYVDRARPLIVFFKPRYAHYRSARVLKPDTPELLQGAVVELPKLETRSELMGVVDNSALLIDLEALSSLPNMTRLLNEQRRSLGLQPLRYDK